MELSLSGWLRWNNPGAYQTALRMDDQRGAVFLIPDQGRGMMTAKYSNVEQNRLEKVERLRSQGIEPYPTRAERTHTSQEAITAFEKAEASAAATVSATGVTGEVAEPMPATLVGRMRSMRADGQDHLCAHRGWSCGRIQVFLRANDVGQEQLDLFNREFDLGDFVQASGEMFRTRTGEITLRVNSIPPIGQGDHAAPGRQG